MKNNPDNQLGEKEFQREIRNQTATQLFWFLVLACSLSIAVYSQKQASDKLAINTAMVNINKDISLRVWATKHGGVYVPTTERTPSNPYLPDHIPERNIVTPLGKKLTLMNPAYMIRQINEEARTQKGVKVKLTSLKLLNPTNVPNAWEKTALLSFEKGEAKALEFIEKMEPPIYI